MTKIALGFLAGVALMLALQPAPVNRIITSASVGPAFSMDDLKFGAKVHIYQSAGRVNTVTLRFRAVGAPGVPCEPYTLDSSILTTEASLRLESLGLSLESVEINR